MRYFKRNGVARYHFSDSSNKLVLGDSLQLLPELSAGIFDMISPKGEKMKELKPCPFCGGEAEIIEVKDNPPETIAIQCKSGCGVSVHNKGMEENVLIERWNTRAKEVNDD